MFAASGFQVRFLKVTEKTGYNSVKWVRYLTKAGNYTILEPESALINDNDSPTPLV